MYWLCVSNRLAKFLSQLCSIQLFLNSTLCSRSLTANGIKEIKTDTFRNLYRLTNLYLNENNISTIQVGTFDDLPRLTFLSLSSNGIKEIKPDTFRNQFRLTYLNLSFNDIKEMKGEIFQDLPSLKSLELGGNGMKIQAEMFQNLSILTRLDLSGNDMKEIKPEIFKYLSSLTDLYLNDNDIKYIQRDIFGNLPNLEKLYLNKNSIDKIQVGTFDDLPRLRYLDLSGNDIKSIKGETFQNIYSLTTLDLGGNDMKEINAELFQYLSSLKTLYLHNNSITYIQRGIFESLPNLESLYLYENNIEKIQVGTFDNLPSLIYLDLSKNRIKTYEDGVFLFLPSITFIDLRNNTDMMCGCHLPALVNYTNSKFGRVVDVQGECQTNSANNQIQVIPIMEYSQCQNYSLFQRNLQCQTCSGILCNEGEVTNCTGDEPVCENKITTNGVTLKFEKSCSTYRNCLVALRSNTFKCNKWTSGVSCVSCCTGNLCKRNDSIGWTNSFLFHLIYNSTFKNIIKDIKTAENVSRAMEYELSNLTGVFEVEYCGLEGQQDVFSINCLVPNNVTKDEVFKQISETFNTSETLRNLGIQKDKMELIGEMVCNENTTSTNSHTFYWPMTKVGTNVAIPCGANTSTRHCTAVDLEMQKCSPFTGIWQEPQMSQCYISGGTTEKPNNPTRWTSSFLFHLIYDSTFKNIKDDIKTAENVSRAMEHELLNLTGAFEVEYCGLEIFSINCSVPDEITKEQVLKQMFRTFNTSQTLRNLGIQLRYTKLIDETLPEMWYIPKCPQISM
ncbi:toll-like receptor 5 [Octopus bimaculoides]|uniref:toll-like receptor 5 n=1 Tax=Octopus bimaculoides TaxID=37653 RepID=UPI0022E0662E|nr:toll-like receptor 5 [Octopus bimaculoides]